SDRACTRRGAPVFRSGSLVLLCRYRWSSDLLRVYNDAVTWRSIPPRVRARTKNPSRSEKDLISDQIGYQIPSHLPEICILPELAPCLGPVRFPVGCRGFIGPVPPPLWIRRGKLLFSC